MKKRVLSAMPSQTFEEGALDAAQQTGKLSYDGYKKVWSDEFNGDTGSTKEAASYTSGRVSTQNKQTFTYDDLNAVQRFQRDMDTFLHLHYLKSCCWWKLGWKSKR